MDIIAALSVREEVFLAAKSQNDAFSTQFFVKETRMCELFLDIVASH